MSVIQDDYKIVKQVTTLLKEEYNLAHTHLSLAKDYFINERKLRKIFKEITGKTINNYQTEVRMGKAKEFLSKTDDTVKTIALNIGLDIRTFEKHFKRSTGMTPLEWRKESKKKWDNSKKGAFNKK